MRIVLIVNPYASRVAVARVRVVEETLRRAGTVDTRLTERRGHATELAAAADGADAVVVFGGDGVVNEAVNGLPAGTPFGALPGGGTSVFARALGLSRDPLRAADRVASALVEGRTRRITLGRVEGRRFAFAAGLGLDAAVVRRVEGLGRREDGRRRGDLAFVGQTARQVVAKRPEPWPEIEVHGLGRVAAAFVANCDPYTYAGAIPLHLAPHARFELGLDLVAPHRVTPGSVARLLRRSVRVNSGRPLRDVLYAHDLDRIEITCDRPLPLQADGEDLGDVEHVVFEAERDAIAALV